MPKLLTVKDGSWGFVETYRKGQYVVDDEHAEAAASDIANGAQGIELEDWDGEEPAGADESNSARSGILTADDLKHGSDYEPEGEESEPEPEPAEVEEPVEFGCEQCEKVYKSQPALDRHVERNHSEDAEE